MHREKSGIKPPPQSAAAKRGSGGADLDSDDEEDDDPGFDNNITRAYALEHPDWIAQKGTARSADIAESLRDPLREFLESLGVPAEQL